MLVYVFLVVAATPVPVKSDREVPIAVPGHICTNGEIVRDRYQCPAEETVPTPFSIEYPRMPIQATRPVPRNYPGGWVVAYDYPSRSLAYDEEGTTGFRLTIGLDGKVSDCAIISSSGFALLDAATCKHITRRARFSPALDNDGNPIEGSYSNRVTWRLPEMPSFAQQIDLVPSGPQATFGVRIEINELSYPLEALEKGMRGHANVLLLISETGNVTSCSVKTSTGSPLLDTRSCDLASKWTFLPGRDFAGKAIAGDTSHEFVWILPDAWKEYQKTGLYPKKSVD